MKKVTNIRTIFLLIMLGVLSYCNTSTEIEQPEAKHTPRTPSIDTVEIIQMKFKPEILYISKGDSVIFINRDMVDHDVTDELSGSWTSTTLTPGQSWGKIFTQNEDYFCSLHVIMKGNIRLEPNP